MTRWNRAGASASLVIATLLLPAAPAGASCIEPPPYPRAIEEAASVFVGTVVATTNAGRWVTVRVEEVWKGDDIAAEVEIQAGPEDPPGDATAISSLDRRYRAGTTYLFFPWQRRGEIFFDNACTQTSVFRPSLERFRPAGATASSPSPSPTPEESPSDDHDHVASSVSTFQWFLAVFFALAGSASIVAIWRYGRRSPSTRPSEGQTSAAVEDVEHP